MGAGYLILGSVWCSLGNFVGGVIFLGVIFMGGILLYLEAHIFCSSGIFLGCYLDKRSRFSGRDVFYGRRAPSHCHCDKRRNFVGRDQFDVLFLCIF